MEVTKSGKMGELTGEEVEALQRELAEAKSVIAQIDASVPVLLQPMMDAYVHASALERVCEEMQVLLVSASVPIPEHIKSLMQKTKKLHDIENLEAVVEVFNLMRKSASDDKKTSDALLLQKAISAFTTPHPGEGLSNDAAVRLAGYFEKKIRATTSIVEAVARSEQGKQGADKSHARHREGKVVAKKLWDEWQEDASLYPLKGDFDEYAAKAASVGKRAVRNWRLGWERGTQ